MTTETLAFEMWKTRKDHHQEEKGTDHLLHTEVCTKYRSLYKIQVSKDERATFIKKNMAKYNSSCKKISNHLELGDVVYIRSSQTYSFIWKAKYKVLLFIQFRSNASSSQQEMREVDNDMVERGLHRMSDLLRFTTQTSSRMRTRIQVLSTRAAPFLSQRSFSLSGIRVSANIEKVITVLRVIKFISASSQ